MKIIKIYELLRCDFKTLMTIVPVLPIITISRRSMAGN